LKSIRTIFFTGLIILLPALITIYVLGFTFNLIDSLLGNLFSALLGITIPGLGFLVTIGIILLVGLIATNVIGHKLLKVVETAFARIPIIKPVYTSTRQIINAFSAQQRKVFESVVMLDYPRKGLYALAFTTTKAAEEIQQKTVSDVITVFIPTTPNPTSGFLLMVPSNQLIQMDMTVEDALKLIVSGGVVAPSWPVQEKNRHPLNI